MSPTGLKSMPRTSEALMAQYLNVRQRNLKALLPLRLPDREFLHGQPNILPINLAWQWYHYISAVPKEAVSEFISECLMVLRYLF